MQQSCALSVKGSFVTFVLPADHMYLMHMVFICVPFCPQCQVQDAISVDKGSGSTNLDPESYNTSLVIKGLSILHSVTGDATILAL
jgi:hypothetical protein